jgi:hypothetical protein
MRRYIIDGLEECRQSMKAEVEAYRQMCKERPGTERHYDDMINYGVESRLKGFPFAKDNCWVDKEGRWMNVITEAHYTEYPTLTNGLFWPECEYVIVQKMKHNQKTNKDDCLGQYRVDWPEKDEYILSCLHWFSKGK